MDAFPIISLVILFFLFQLQYSQRFKNGIMGFISFISKSRIPSKLKWLILSSIAGSLPIKNRTIFASPLLHPLSVNKSDKAAITFLTSHFYYFISPLSPALITFLLLSGLSFSQALPYLIIPVIPFLLICYKLMPAENIKETEAVASVWDYLFAFALILLLGVGFYTKNIIPLIIALIVFIIGKDYKFVINKSLITSLFLITIVLLAKPIISDFIKSLSISINPLILALLVGLATGSSKLSCTLLYGIPMSFSEMIMTYPLWWMGYMLSPLHLCPMYSALVFDANYKKLYKKSLIAVLGTVIISEIVYALIFLISNLN